jgi:hypothetical protein
MNRDAEYQAATAEAIGLWTEEKARRDKAQGPVVVGPPLAEMIWNARTAVSLKYRAEAEAAQREAEARAAQEAQEAEAALEVAPTVVPEATPEPAVTPDVLKALMKLIRATPPEIEGG